MVYTLERIASEMREKYPPDTILEQAMKLRKIDDAPKPENVAAH